MRIVFFGTPAFAAEILLDLLQKDVSVVAVVTMPDKPQGRSYALKASPVKDALLRANPSIPLFQPETLNDPIFLKTITELQADVFVVAAFGQIFKESFLELPKFGCINIHTSLLPKYRGAAPIQRAIIDGNIETGVTIMYMVKKLDAGDILLQKKVAISSDMTAGELERKLCSASKDALDTVLKQIEQGTVKPIPQDPELVTYAKKVEKEDGLLNWDAHFKAVYNRYRGVTPKPGAWCWINIRGHAKRLKIHKMKPLEVAHKENPGKLIDMQNGLVVACHKGALILEEIQLEGKKSMAGEEFLRGYSLKDISFCTTPVLD